MLRNVTPLLISCSWLHTSLICSQLFVRNSSGSPPTPKQRLFPFYRWANWGTERPITKPDSNPCRLARAWARKPCAESFISTHPQPPRPRLKKKIISSNRLSHLWNHTLLCGCFVCAPDSNNCSNIYKLWGDEEKVLRNEKKYKEMML